MSQVYMCEYCHTELSTIKNRSRHYKTCTIKQANDDINKDEIIEKLKKDNEKKDKKLQKYIEEIRELEKDYLQFAKDQAKTSGKTLTNNGTINNDNRQYNMFYVINNYKDAHNIEDLFNTPLTDKEIQYIMDNGSTLGCYYILKSRCIDDIDIDKRPFHCIDTSRCKYLLRSKNDWDVDQDGETILTIGCNKIKDAYDIEDISDIEQYGKNMQQLLKLETKGKTKVLKELSKKTLLKNNIKNIE
jgi:hypothetical protein